MEKCIDKVGQEIVVGSIIAYGHALGRCAGIRIGRVLKIGQKELSTWGPSTLEWRINVIGIDDDWSHNAPKLNTRVGTLQFPNRIIVLHPDQVPGNYLQLFDSYQS